MVMTYYSTSKDQPRKVATPASDQPNREITVSLSPFAPENFVSRDGFGRSVPRQPARLHFRLNLVLTYGIPPDFRGGVHLSI